MIISFHCYCVIIYGFLKISVVIEYPKTDWTYSPFSKDRVEIAPGVVAMPNMSRRHISSYDKYTNTEPQGSYRNNRHIKPQALFSERSQKTESRTIVTFVKKVLFGILMLFVGIFYVCWNSISFVYKSAHRISLKIVKNIHRLTSRVMLLDTWLLRKRGNSGKSTYLYILCAVPLFLIGGFWLFSNMGDQNYGQLFQTSNGLPVASVESVGIQKEISQYPDDSNLESQHEKSVDRLYPSLQANNVPVTISSLTKDQLEIIGNYIERNFDVNKHIDYDEIIVKLLNTDPMLNKYNPKLQQKLEQQQSIIDDLTNELNKIKQYLVNLQNEKIDVDNLRMNIQKENMQKLDQLVYRMNRCCRKSINIDSYIFRTVTSLINNPNFLQNQVGFKNWLNSLFIAKTELEGKLSNITEHLDSKLDVLLENNNRVLMDQVIARLNLEFSQKYKTTNIIQGSEGSDITLTDQKIKDIVTESLKIYDADKTGLVDYAMEPMGGQVITTRCTESYHTGTAVVSVLGLPLWYPTSSPRTVITPGINPGKCWAFQNYPGLLVIKLMVPIKVEAFSLEHISKLLVPDGKIDSAPRDFEVYGLTNEQDRNGVRIGQYIYDYNGEPLQFFVAQTPNQVFEFIELRINSNHGNPNYTCLYRFRVHGQKQVQS
ncbi:hypothetical protein WA026_000473 [Henosepilachna vigintioctopunctata]|uniref:SUN domain-containing protein n=1 Tax=Henosepilachna vigintioctopunctata TaxID=420089 RepID=A0AAW1V0K0_9CUCU